MIPIIYFSVKIKLYFFYLLIAIYSGKNDNPL